jgi:hypothetical protein
MGDWRKIQYRQPSHDPLAEAEDFKYGVGGVFLLVAAAACVLALLWVVVTAFA